MSNERKIVQKRIFGSYTTDKIVPMKDSTEKRIIKERTEKSVNDVLIDVYQFAKINQDALIQLEATPNNLDFGFRIMKIFKAKNLRLFNYDSEPIPGSPTEKRYMLISELDPSDIPPLESLIRNRYALLENNS